MILEEMNDSFVEEEVLEVLEFLVVGFELEYDVVEQIDPKCHGF